MAHPNYSDGIWVGENALRSLLSAIGRVYSCETPLGEECQGWAPEQLLAACLIQLSGDHGFRIGMVRFNENGGCETFLVPICGDEDPFEEWGYPHEEVARWLVRGGCLFIEMRSPSPGSNLLAC